MKRIQSQSFLIIFILLFTACKDKSTTISESSQAKNTTTTTSNVNSEVSQHYSIVDIRIRKVTEKEYVKEFVMPNFNSNRKELSGFVYNKELYLKNSKYNNSKHKKDIFTTTKTFPIKGNTFSKESQISKSSSPIISSNFQHKKELMEYLLRNEFEDDNDIQEIFEITCDFHIVDCPNESWYDTSYFGEPCIELSNCSVTVGFVAGQE